MVMRKLDEFCDRTLYIDWIALKGKLNIRLIRCESDFFF